MKYVATIIFYNPDESAIKRVETYCNNFQEVLVIDNSEESNLETALKLKKYRNCVYHKMNGNSGMSEALNYAFYFAIDKKYDFILTMDQDSIYNDKNIYNMKEYIENNYDENIGIYSPNYSKLYYNKKRKKFIEAKPVLRENEEKYVDFCMTSGSFINVKALSKILPLDDYFIAYVDNFLSQKLLEEKYKLLRLGNSYFAQQVGAIVNDNLYNRIFRVLHHSDVRYYYMVRNNLFLQSQFKHNYKLRIKNIIGLTRIILNIFLCEKNKLKKLKASKSGYKDFKRGIKGKVPDKSVVW